MPPAGQRPAHLLRRAFTLDQPVITARAYATAQGVYELFVNGDRVGDAELTPGFTDYRTALQVQTYDLSETLTEGTNVVAAVLSDGWFRGINGMFRDADCFGDRTALVVQLHLTLADGTDVVLGTDPLWRSSVGAIIGADLMEGITADLRLEPTDWTKPQFDGHRLGSGDGGPTAGRRSDLVGGASGTTHRDPAPTEHHPGPVR